MDWFMAQHGWVRLLIALPLGFIFFAGLTGLANAVEALVRDLTDKHSRSAKAYRRMRRRFEK
jgi:hypothetical protein